MTFPVRGKLISVPAVQAEELVLNAPKWTQLVLSVERFDGSTPAVPGLQAAVTFPSP